MRNLIDLTVGDDNVVIHHSMIPYLLSLDSNIKVTFITKNNNVISRRRITISDIKEAVSTKLISDLTKFNSKIYNFLTNEESE